MASPPRPELVAEGGPVSTSRVHGMRRRVAMMVGGCATIGLGVSLVLHARLGADGYATAVDGIVRTTGVAFWVVNSALGLGLIAIAWARGIRPCIGTLVAAVIVGVVVSLAMPHLPEVDALASRIAIFAVGFTAMTIGVAAYLAASLGAGPAEAAALAFDPPIPFRWTYSALHLAGATLGWALGAAVGAGTAIVIIGVGPAVDLMIRRLFGMTPAATVNDARP